MDVTANRAHDIRTLLPALPRVLSAVVISTRAVYLAPDGYNINGDAAPVFPVPIEESNPTFPSAPPELNPVLARGLRPLQGRCRA